MLRLSVCVALATLALPATASAAGFGELPFTPVSGNAECVRATGAPGEVVRLTPTGAELLTASAAGYANAVEVDAPAAPEDCPAAAGSATGAGVLAFRTEPDQKPEVDVALREPGGAWGAVTKLASAAAVFNLTSAVSARGDAVVAWATGNDSPSKPAYHVMVAVRPAGRSFGAPVELPTDSPYVPPVVRVGVSDAGEAIAAWTTKPASSPTDPYDITSAVDVAVAPPGGAFGAAVAVTRTGTASTPALAVAPDGRALLAAYDDHAVRVAERPAGGAFAAVRSVPVADDLTVLVADALGADGSAVVGWQPVQGLRGLAITRAGLGAFSAPLKLSAAVPSFPEDPLVVALDRVFTAGFGPLGLTSGDDLHAGDIRAAVTGDGRAELTWMDVTSVQRAALPAVRAATIPLGGTAAAVQTLGDPLRLPGAIAPVVLAGGAPAVAWSDNAGDPLEPKGGRLRLAAEGVATAADPAPPKVTVGKPLDSALRAVDALELPIRCNAACEVSAGVIGHAAQARTELDQAGEGDLSISQIGLGDATFVPARPGPVKVLVQYGAPGARTPASKVVTLRLRRAATPGLPRLLDMQVMRKGAAITLTARVSKAVEPSDLVAYGAPTRSRSAAPSALGFTTASAKKGKRFTLTVQPAKGVEYVTLALATEASGYDRLRTVKAG